jgi:hypothetical protein
MCLSIYFEARLHHKSLYCVQLPSQNFGTASNLSPSMNNPKKYSLTHRLAVAFCWLVRVVLLINQQGFGSKKAKREVTKQPLLASLAGSHIAHTVLRRLRRWRLDSSKKSPPCSVASRPSHEEDGDWIPVRKARWCFVIL